MSDKLIAAIVASRERPDRLDSLLQAAADTDTRHVEWFVGLDDDDEHNYPRRDGVNYIVGKRAGLIGVCNALAARVWDDYPILGQFDDDQWPRTRHWDVQVIRAMEKLGGGLVYTNDGWMGEQTPVCPFWSSAFAKRIGWLYHPDLRHLFADNTVLELARSVGRVAYLPDVLIEHVHPILEKAEWDDSYRESNSGETWSHDEAVFKGYVASQQFRDHVDQLRELA